MHICIYDLLFMLKEDPNTGSYREYKYFLNCTCGIRTPQSRPPYGGLRATEHAGDWDFA